MAILYIAMAFIKYTYMALRFLRSVQFVVPSEARASPKLTNPLLSEARASLELTNPLLRDHRPPCWNKRHRMPWQPSLQRVRSTCYQDILHMCHDVMHLIFHENFCPCFPSLYPHYLMYLVFFIELFLSFLSLPPIYMFLMSSVHFCECVSKKLEQ